jgi:D-arabinose 1-dehydrogenase-like Zn-dependent alcohol dehydrogenase
MTAMTTSPGGTGPHGTMLAWTVGAPGPAPGHPLRLGPREIPAQAPDEVLVQVTACGVCRTDLHLAEGDLAPRRVGGPTERPPVPLDSAVVFAPAGELVPHALEAVTRGGTVALAGIHMSQVPPLDYDRHLFQEKALVSVAANTRADGEELLRLAVRLEVQVHLTDYAFEAVDEALADLAADRMSGSAVVTGYPSLT